LTADIVVVRAPATQAGRVVAALSTLGDPTAVRSSSDGQVHLLSVPAPVGDEASVRSLRDRVTPLLGAIPDAEYAVSGETAGHMDYASHQASKLPWVIGFVLLLTFLVMTLTFRSIVIAFTSIAINLLSAAAAFGVLVLVFQHRWAEGLLDFRSTGAVVAWIPLFLFVVLFGLSMDYHVFVVSRIREAARRGLPTREAVATGVIDSAGVVTSAAVVMVAVFGVFASLSMIEFKELGVGLATAVALDALVVRVVILPSIMSLLGRANWWPGGLSTTVDAAGPLPSVRVPVAAQ
jgi:RND superfamily putative drug exporter